MRYYVEAMPSPTTEAFGAAGGSAARGDDRAMEIVAGSSDRLALRDVADYARRVEALGVDTLHVPETVHDGLMVAGLALGATTRLRVRTSLILAFVRSPMQVALTAWDLALASGGRFELGLGTQIRQNIEDRFGVPWTPPIRRMAGYVEAVRAAWHSFATGEPLHVDTPDYRLTRLQPYFNPGPLPAGVAPPPIALGGVGDVACRLAGSAADVFVTHPTNSSPRFLRELCWPQLDAGAATAARRPPRLICGTPMIVGRDRRALARVREVQRRQFGFLLSTPAYRRSLELYGRGELSERLRWVTRKGEWDRLGELVDDEVLDELIPQGTWARLPGVIAERFEGLIDGVIVPVQNHTDDAELARLITRLREILTRRGSVVERGEN